MEINYQKVTGNDWLFTMGCFTSHYKIDDYDLNHQNSYMVVQNRSKTRCIFAGLCVLALFFLQWYNDVEQK